MASSKKRARTNAAYGKLLLGFGALSSLLGASMIVGGVYGSNGAIAVGGIVFGVLIELGMVVAAIGLALVSYGVVLRIRESRR